MGIPEWIAVLDWDWTATLKSQNKALCNEIDKRCLTGEMLGETEGLRSLFFERSHGGKLSPEDQKLWLRRTVEIYIKAGLTHEQIKHALAGVRLRNHFLELLQFFQTRNIPVAIISYGVRQFIESVINKHQLSSYIHKVYAIELLFNESGVTYDYSQECCVVPEEKGVFSRMFADEFGVAHDRIIAIGDSMGDAQLGHLKENRIGIVEAHKDAKDLLDHFDTVIVSDSFLPVIYWLRERIKSIKA